MLNLSKDTPVTVLPKLFISAMCAQLRRMGFVITEFSKVRLLSTCREHFHVMVVTLLNLFKSSVSEHFFFSVLLIAKKVYKSEKTGNVFW